MTWLANQLSKSVVIMATCALLLGVNIGAQAAKSADKDVRINKLAGATLASGGYHRRHNYYRYHAPYISYRSYYYPHHYYRNKYYRSYYYPTRYRHGYYYGPYYRRGPHFNIRFGF